MFTHLSLCSPTLGQTVNNVNNNYKKYKICNNNPHSIGSLLAVISYGIIVYIVYVFDESLYGIALGRETIEMHKWPLKTSCGIRGHFISTCQKNSLHLCQTIMDI